MPALECWRCWPVAVLLPSALAGDVDVMKQHEADRNTLFVLGTTPYKLRRPTLMDVLPRHRIG
jgi:hypothetical protein